MTSSETTPESLVITLFGPMQVLIDGQPLPRLRSRKGLWLLALLTLRHGRRVERDWLAGTLWPDIEQTQAYANLRPILSELRNGLGSQKERLRSPDRHTLLLDLTGADVDLLRFDAAIESPLPAEREQAAALYRGLLLEGCTEEWVFQERTAREQQCLHTLQKLGETALSSGDTQNAIRHFQRMIALDPWLDTAQRGLMHALDESGDRNAALQVYREFVEVLRDDPSAVPDPQTTALYVRLRTEARQIAPRPIAAPAPVSVPTVTGYLPHPLTDLIGREDECLEVASRLRRSRLVTLTGLGGIGKTRLALAVARQVAKEYADGVWLIALDSLTEGRQVLPQLASVLGLKEESERRLRETVTRFLQSKCILLVLDNCEHLLEASTQMISHLLRECSELRVLTTSREALEITGETAWTVPSLAVPALTHLPTGQATLLRVLSSYEGVQLFVERAQAVQKTFALTGSNAQTVARVCFRLEGIPLALELAAARIKAMTIEQIAARLDNELNLLMSGNRTAHSRQQTLRATLDWSYTLLIEQEQRLLCRLSVFAGSWTLEAAERVCAGTGIDADRILSLLTELVDKSLVNFEVQNAEAGGRYRMLEMVRQYGAEKLQESGEADRFQTRHLAWFVTLAEQAEPELKGSNQAVWLRRLESEYDNLRAALARSATEQQETEWGLRLSGAIWWFWKIRGRFSEGRQYLATALAREGTQGKTEARAKALNGAGALALNQGEYAAAQAFHEESLALYQQLGNRQGVASTLNNLANIVNNRSGTAAAIILRQESLSIYRELDDKPGIATALSNLGGDIRQQGDYAMSQTLLEESLEIRRKLRDEQGLGITLASLGNLARLQGNYGAAQTLLEESLEIRRELNDKAGVAYTLSHLGALADGLGDFLKARTLYEESLEIRRELGNREGIAWSLNNLGLVALHEGHFGEAQTLFAESLFVFRELQDKSGSAWALNHLGDVAHRCGEYVQAHRQFAESLRLFRELEDKEGMAENLRDIAAVLAASSEWKNAASLWGAAEALRESIGAPLPQVEQESYEREVKQARLALTEAAFVAAWEAGHTLTCEQATLFALTE